MNNKSMAALVITTLLVSGCKFGTLNGFMGSTSNTTTVVAGTPGPAGPQGDPGTPAPTPVPTPAPTPIEDATQLAIDNLVASENAYRLSLGETELSPGLSCSVQAVSSGQWLSSSSPGYNASQGVLVMTGTNYTYLYADMFNQPNASSGTNNLIPAAIAPLFVGINYKISCSGQLVILNTEYYNFSLNSDDGSILTIDGTQVVNNDGGHSITLKTGTKNLREGVHTFSLQYSQSNGGSFGLILLMNGSSIDPTTYYH